MVPEILHKKRGFNKPHPEEPSKRFHKFAGGFFRRPRSVGLTD
jgi:hypothetical protein